MTEPLDLTSFISQDGRQLVTDSRAVAIAFGKPHKNVLRTIEAALRSRRSLISDHARRNFEPSSYLAGNGKLERMFRMTAKGLSELAMGFSGDDAREVRIRFLDAFEEVASRLERADKSITELMHALTRREGSSDGKGKLGSQLMNERKREKPSLMAERAVLEERSQPCLDLVVDNAQASSRFRTSLGGPQRPTPADRGG